MARGHTVELEKFCQLRFNGKLEELQNTAAGWAEPPRTRLLRDAYLKSLGLATYQRPTNISKLMMPLNPSD